MSDDAIATIGDNNPPASEAHSSAIRELEIEAEAYLTGADITDQQTADELGMLIGKVRMAELQADTARKAEKKPHDDAAAEVQEVYKPILARAARVQRVGKQLLATWIAKVDEENKRLAEEARQEAARQAEEAAKAIQDSTGDLEARTKAEELAKEAEKTAKAARKVGTASSGVQSGGRKISLRTVIEVELEDPYDLKPLAQWVWKNSYDDLKDAFLGIAKRSALAGNRNIPGVRVIEKKEAV